MNPSLWLLQVEDKSLQQNNIHTHPHKNLHSKGYLIHSRYKSKDTPQTLENSDGLYCLFPLCVANVLHVSGCFHVSLIFLFFAFIAF